jgi:hypothetical protein
MTDDMDDSVPVPCAPDIYANGKSACVLAGPRSKVIEAWVRRVAAVSEQQVDWHFVGGRAVVRYIGDVVRVIGAVRELLPELEAAYTNKTFSDDQVMFYWTPETLAVADPEQHAVLTAEAEEQRAAFNARIDRAIARTSRVVEADLRAYALWRERVANVVPCHAVIACYQTVGVVDDVPVVVELHWEDFAGECVLFWNSPDRAADRPLIEAWLVKTFPAITERRVLVIVDGSVQLRPST